MTINTILRLYSHHLSAQLDDPEAVRALYDFTKELNAVETTMPDSTIRKAALASLGSSRTKQRAYKWLSGVPVLQPILERLSKFPFLHAERLIPEKRFEEMGYGQRQSVCCIPVSIDLVLIS